MKKSTNKINRVLLFTGTLLFSISASAQTNYRFGTASGTGGATGSGYSLTDQKATFVNSASPSVYGTTNVTMSLSSQQYGNATAYKFEGMTDTTYKGAVAFGAAGVDLVNTIPGSFNRFATLALFGTTADNHFTINKKASAGTGITTTTTGAFSLGIFTDVLMDTAGKNINGITDLNTDIRFADLTLTFNEPVSNPVIHLGGLGGTTFQTLSGPGGVRKSWLGYSGAFELLDAYTVTRLSGSAYFDVDTLAGKVRDAAVWLGNSSAATGTCFGGKTSYGASGSFVVNAINISSLHLRIYLRSDPGRITASIAVTPCDGSVADSSFTAAYYPRWSTKNDVRADGFTLSVSFAREKITGNVFNDPDGGNVNNSSGVANLIPAGIYANLIDTATGLVIKSVIVGTNGVFDLGEQNANGYKVILSSSLGTAGSLPPSFTPPAGWVSTGAFNGASNTGNTGNLAGISQIFTVNESSNTTDINFAMERTPTATTKTFSVVKSDFSSTPPATYPVVPGYVSILSSSPALVGYDGTGGKLSGTDPDDCALPNNCNTGSTFTIGVINSNTLLYYDFGSGPVALSNNTVINGYDPAKLVIYGQEGSGTTGSPVGFTYSMTDAAGMVSSPAIYSIISATPLPVILLSFSVTQSDNNQSLLAWNTAIEANLAIIKIEYSSNGMEWEIIGARQPKGNNSEYSFIHAHPAYGDNFYRLKFVEIGDNATYSPVRSLDFDKMGSSGINLYPNPAHQTIQITGDGILLDGAKIQLINSRGQVIFATVNMRKNQSVSVDISELPKGLYIVNVMVKGNNYSRSLIVE